MMNCFLFFLKVSTIIGVSIQGWRLNVSTLLLVHQLFPLPFPLFLFPGWLWLSPRITLLLWCNSYFSCCYDETSGKHHLKGGRVYPGFWFKEIQSIMAAGAGGGQSHCITVKEVGLSFKISRHSPQWSTSSSEIPPSKCSITFSNCTTNSQVQRHKPMGHLTFSSQLLTDEYVSLLLLL